MPEFSIASYRGELVSLSALVRPDFSSLADASDPHLFITESEKACAAGKQPEGSSGRPNRRRSRSGTV
jgi:hypothetical protein